MVVAKIGSIFGGLKGINLKTKQVNHPIKNLSQSFLKIIFPPLTLYLILLVFSFLHTEIITPNHQFILRLPIKKKSQSYTHMMGLITIPMEIHLLQLDKNQ